MRTFLSMGHIKSMREDFEKAIKLMSIDQYSVDDAVALLNEIRWVKRVETPSKDHPGTYIDMILKA